MRSEPDELEQSDGLDLENRCDPPCKKKAPASRISVTSDSEELESDGVDLEKGPDPPSKKEVPASRISTVLDPDKIDESDVADLEIGSDLLCKKEVPSSANIAVIRILAVATGTGVKQSGASRFQQYIRVVRHWGLG